MAAILQRVYEVSGLSFWDIVYGVVLWLCAAVGQMARVNRTMAFWRPLALLYSAAKATQYIGFIAAIFVAPVMFKKAGLNLWESTVGVGLAGALLAAIPLIMHRLAPGIMREFVELKSGMDANIDKVFAGTNYPARPLVFEEPEPVRSVG